MRYVDGVDLDDANASELAAIAADASQDARVRKYARLSLMARTCRLAGRIDMALDWEGRAERVYDSLPGDLQWRGESLAWARAKP